jgi:hypothetical protein
MLLFVIKKIVGFASVMTKKIIGVTVMLKAVLRIRITDISQYRLRFEFSLLYKTVFHLNWLTAQLSYEGRAAVSSI